jgi:hypothetical protein
MIIICAIDTAVLPWLVAALKALESSHARTKHELLDPRSRGDDAVAGGGKLWAYARRGKREDVGLLELTIKKRILTIEPSDVYNWLRNG